MFLRWWFESISIIQCLETFHYYGLKNVEALVQSNVYLPSCRLFCFALVMLNSLRLTLRENKVGSVCVFSKVLGISEVQSCYGSGALCNDLMLSWQAQADKNKWGIRRAWRQNMTLRDTVSDMNGLHNKWGNSINHFHFALYCKMVRAKKI